VIGQPLPPQLARVVDNGGADPDATRDFSPGRGPPVRYRCVLKSKAHGVESAAILDRASLNLAPSSAPLSAERWRIPLDAGAPSRQSN